MTDLRRWLPLYEKDAFLRPLDVTSQEQVNSWAYAWAKDMLVGPRGGERLAEITKLTDPDEINDALFATISGWFEWLESLEYHGVRKA